MSRHALKFISGKYQGGEYPIPDEGEIIIGRAADLDLVLVEDMVSRKHAKLTSQAGDLTITDLGSTNGTFVNGEKTRRAKLRKNDRILIGTAILRVISGSDMRLFKDTPKDRESVRLAAKRMMEELASRAPEASTMSGDLEEVPLPDLLQLFASNRRSGVFRVSGSHSGRILIKEGQIQHAMVAGDHSMGPMKALCRMVMWEKGAFRLDPYEDPGPLEETFEAPTESVLMEALRQADEVRKMLEELPPVDTHLSWCIPMTPRLSALDAEELDTLQAALNFEVIREVIDRSPHTDHKTIASLQKLLKEGYLEVA